MAPTDAVPGLHARAQPLTAQQAAHGFAAAEVGTAKLASVAREPCRAPGFHAVAGASEAIAHWRWLDLRWRASPHHRDLLAELFPKRSLAASPVRAVFRYCAGCRVRK